MLDRLPERSDEDYTPRRRNGFTYERQDTRYDYDYNRREDDGEFRQWSC